MSTQKAPNNNKQWLQGNQGDYFGNVVDSFNMDFDTSPGVAKASKKLTPLLVDDLGTDNVQAIVMYDRKYTVVSQNEFFTCSVSNDPTTQANWSEITAFRSEDLGFETDAIVFQDLLLISQGTDILSFNGSVIDNDWWTVATSGTALTANKTHTLEVLRTGNDTLFVTDDNHVRYYNAAAGHTSVDLETEFTAHVLLPGLDKMWVGTYTETSSNAFIYEIQVGNDIASNAYPVSGLAALSGFVYRNTPYIITERGFIQAFNGAGFDTIAQFPFALTGGYPDGVKPGLIQDSSHARAIHPKGCQVRGKYAYIFVDLANEYNSGEQLDERSHSGVWVLDLETFSLTHRYGLATTNDKGSAKVQSSGPIFLPQATDTFIMVGSEIDDAPGVWMESDETTFGHFTLARHEADSVADIFESLTIKADTLASGESVQAAERTEVRDTLTVEDVTWLTATQFTTSNALTGVEVGDEVFIYAGAHAGEHAYITAIDGTTTKSVTVDTSIGTLNDVSSIYITNFNKMEDEMDSTSGEWKKVGGPEGAHTFAQYRLWLTGEVTIRETISKSNNKEGL